MARLTKKEMREGEKRADADAATLARNAVMARLAAGRSCLQASIDAIDEALSLFVDTDDDRKGDEREDLIDTAIEMAGMATRALEHGQEDINRIDPTEGEPWDEDDEEDE